MEKFETPELFAEPSAKAIQHGEGIPRQLPSAVDQNASVRPRRLRIVVAEIDPTIRRHLDDCLDRLGHDRNSPAAGSELLECCRQYQPDLVVVGPSHSGLNNGSFDWAWPLVVVSAVSQPELLPRAVSDHRVLGWLTMPIHDASFEIAARLAISRFQQAQALRREVKELIRTIEDRKLVERGKGAIMRWLHVADADAMSRLTKFSRDRKLTLPDAAQLVLTMIDVLKALEQAGPRPTANCPHDNRAKSRRIRGLGVNLQPVAAALHD